MIMKRFLLGLLALLLFGCAPQQNEPPAQSVDSAMPKTRFPSGPGACP